jgi:aspartate carbamoyltransferase catalytic subunit
MKHLLSAEQLERKELEGLFRSADYYGHRDYFRPMYFNNKIMASLFYEASTRTRLSFETAMLRNGGNVVSTENASQFSSAIKGETLEDTIRVVSSYVDVIVLRHNKVGAAEIAAKYSEVPVINAGDGSGEHPTQALLDVYTVYKKKKTPDGLRYTLVGDLKYGRTIHSLIRLLSLFKDVELKLVSPSELRLPEEHINFIKSKGIRYEEFTDLTGKVLQDTDVLYMTRVQQERSAQKLSLDGCVLSISKLAELNSDAIIMHPLPRCEEIPPIVDFDQRAVYFEQAANGVPVRAAILHELLLRPSDYDGLFG